MTAMSAYSWVALEALLIILLFLGHFRAVGGAVGIEVGSIIELQSKCDAGTGTMVSVVHTLTVET